MRRFLSFFLILCLLLSLCGCTQSQTFYAMDTVMELELWGQDAKTGILQLQEQLQQLESRWSVTLEGSLVSQLNRGQDVTLTDEEAGLLAQLEDLRAYTGGLFDPQLYAVSQAWGFYGQSYRVPTQQEIDVSLTSSQWDLGGALKGYAADQGVQLLSGLRIDRGILNLGGNIQTYGSKPGAEPWLIGIANPFGEGNLGVLQVQGTMAVVTSGSYQRCFTQDGITYHHILDPRTGRPADSGLVSVTVLCQEGLTADVLSTALFVMGLEGGAQFWQEKGGFEAVFVTQEGSVFATPGITLTGTAYEVIGL